MANSWKKERPSISSPLKALLLILFPVSLLFLFLLSPSSNSNPRYSSSSLRTLTLNPKFAPFDCKSSPQASPVFASLVENVTHPFLFSLSDFGSLPDKPHKNIQRILKGKRFRRPDISVTVQKFLEGKGKEGVVVDVGANVGMATFAAAAMGFRVVAFEPVFENLQRICDGMFLNRAWDRVTVFAAAASDKVGKITFHKGWEYHVLRGASKLLSRKAGEAPYLIYEEDERLLQASNSSANEIREFLRSVGYRHCTMHGTDAHCTKDS